MSEENLIDVNPIDQTERNNLQGLIAKLLYLIGLIYGAFIFYGYFSLSKSINNPLLPEYTIGFIYGFMAAKGLVLLIGLSVAQTLIIFKRYLISIIFLSVTFFYIFLRYFFNIIPAV